jgi:hypothetical protein
VQHKLLKSLQWLINTDGPALLEVGIDRHVPYSSLESLSGGLPMWTPGRQRSAVWVDHGETMWLKKVSPPELMEANE